MVVIGRRLASDVSNLHALMGRMATAAWSGSPSNTRQIAQHVDYVVLLLIGERQIVGEVIEHAACDVRAAEQLIGTACSFLQSRQDSVTADRCMDRTRSV